MEKKLAQSTPCHHFHAADGLAYATPAAISRALAGSIGVPECLEGCCFENFEQPDQHYRQIADFLHGWVAGIHQARQTDKGHSLLLAGPEGSGKSHLAVAALRDLTAGDSPARRGLRCKFLDASIVLADLRGSWSSADLRDYLDPDVILLDDLGAARASETQRERLRLILAQRLSHRRPTLISTSLVFPSREAETLLGTHLLNKIRWSYAIVQVSLPNWRRLSE